MSKQKAHDSNNDSSEKRQRTIQFSNTDYLKTKIQIGNKSASVVGYVEDIINEQTFTNRTKNVEFKIFKFILNNNNRIRIQCNIYDDNIEKFMPQIKINEKILLESVAVSNAKSYTKGNLQYELNLQHYSTIIVLGDVDLMKNLKPLKIKFEEIPHKKELIKIKGYLRNNFVQKNKNNDLELFGAITDGTYKLEVLLIKDEADKIETEQGAKLELTGDLQENGMTYILKIKSINDIKILNEKKMELEKLLLGPHLFIIQKPVKEVSEK